jgi:DNA-binding CsgD family transcriptional regulator
MVGRWPFVGRTAQIERLADLTDERMSTLLVGEAGIGKSALAARLGQQLAEAGRPVAAVSGQALSGDVPFEAFATLLSRAGPGAGEVTPGTIAEQVSRALDAGDGAPGLLLVDDVHLLDAESVLVLHRLVIDELATVVMTTSAPAELPTAVRRLVHDGRCRTIELLGLPDSDLAHVLERALGAPVEPRAERSFVRRAKGNPLLLRELLAAAQDQQSLDLVEGVWRLVAEAPVAYTVRELVAARVADLPAEQLSALEAVAATEPLPTEAAVDLVGWSRLESLEASRLVTVRDALGGTQVATAHPIIGEVIRADLPRLRLRRLRADGAAALDSRPDPAPHDLVRAALWRLDSGDHGDPERLLAAARAARVISLEMAERLVRAALAAGSSPAATMLLAEVLTHARRTDEASALLAGLPPESLTPELRDAQVYLDALHRGLLGGDLDAATALVADALAGEPSASQRLRATYASFLAFDGRYEDALAAGSSVAADGAADPETRTIAAIGVVGAHYWLGHGRRSVELADELLPVADGVRGALPYGAPSIALIAICALVDDGDLDAAEERAQRMAQQAVDREDPFAAPRSEYCLGRVLLARGRPASAARLFRRSVSALTPFDLTFSRHLHAMIVRAEAAAGHPAAARAATDVGDAPPDMPPYQPDWLLAEAALAASELDVGRAMEQAAYVARLAASSCQWRTAVAAGHDAARYGAARAQLPDLRLAVTNTDARIAALLLSHTEALAADDGTALDRASEAFAACGNLALAVEAAMTASGAHTRRGDVRAGRASAARAERLGDRCEHLAFPWLAGSSAAVLTARERQVAALASAGRSDAAIATQLGISVRTVQTHLGHAYDKLGIRTRAELADALSREPA